MKLSNQNYYFLIVSCISVKQIEKQNVDNNNVTRNEYIFLFVIIF